MNLPIRFPCCLFVLICVFVETEHPNNIDLGMIMIEERKDVQCLYLLLE